MHRKYRAAYNILVRKSKLEINVKIRDNIKINQRLIMGEVEYFRQNTAM
jgi:hypothetical protein